MNTIEEIYKNLAGKIIHHELAIIIADALNEGHKLNEILKYIKAKGYTQEYIEDEIETLRRIGRITNKNLLPPWNE